MSDLTERQLAKRQLEKARRGKMIGGDRAGTDADRGASKREICRCTPNAIANRVAARMGAEFVPDAPPNALLPTEEAAKILPHSLTSETSLQYEKRALKALADHLAMRALAKPDDGVVRDALDRGLEYAIEAANEINDADSRIFQQIMRDVAKIEAALAKPDKKGKND